MMAPLQSSLFDVIDHKSGRRPRAVAEPAFFCDICGEGNCAADDCLWRAVGNSQAAGLAMPERVAERLHGIWRGFVPASWLKDGSR